MPQLEDCINGETVLTSSVVCLRRSDSGVQTKNKVREKKKRKLGRDSLSLSPQCPLHFCSPCPVSTTAERLGQATLLIPILVRFGELIRSSGCFRYPPPPSNKPSSPFCHRLKLAWNKLGILRGEGGGVAPSTWPCLRHSYTSVGRGRKRTRDNVRKE